MGGGESPLLFSERTAHNEPKYGADPPPKPVADSAVKHGEMENA